MPASEEVYLSAHITPNSLLIPTIKAWRYYLDDQAMSPHTIKAFSGDLHLLAGYLPPDRLLEDISTSELVNFLEWLEKGRGIPCSPTTLARRITPIKAFFRWLHQKGVLLIAPAQARRPPVHPGGLAAGDRYQEGGVPVAQPQSCRPGEHGRSFTFHPLCQPPAPLQGAQDINPRSVG